MTKPILIVEDDPDGQALVAHVVEYMRIPHDLAEDGESASRKLFAANAGHYQAVIIDLQLPGKDGWELLADIRAHSSTQHITCIAVTAFHTSKIREAAIKAGFNAYFPKPLDANQFAHELETLL